MRYISFGEFSPTTEWLAKAAAAAAEAATKPASHSDRTQTRAAYINSKSDIWKALKDGLSALGHAKCWYCESKQARSDKHVDHFRPKNRVKDDDSDGYWWLAFDYTNYRFSCSFCNSPHTNPATGESQGKADWFPLCPGSPRATSLPDLGRELPMLLDPIQQNDPGLLYFEQTGEVRPRYRAEARPIDHDRAKTSIQHYHLDHRDLIDARLDLARRIGERVAEGARHFELSAAAHNPAASTALEGIKRDLRRLIQPQEEYSTTARCVLAGLRNHEWVGEVLDAA